MSTITVLDNQDVTLQYHQDTGIVHHVYKPSIGGESLKEALNTGVDLLRKYSAEKWLSDNRQIDAHTEEETEWINTVWLPNAVNAGWKYWALVVPQSLMARLNMREFTESFHEMGVFVKVFTDPGTAMNWLENAHQ